MPYSEQTVQSVRPWSDKTFSFTLRRPQDFLFENGEFVTIGLKREGKLVARAYSIVSTADRDHLEFLSIHVPDGPLTSHLVSIRPGDSVWVNSKATGSLTLNHVLPGRTLYLFTHAQSRPARPHPLSAGHRHRACTVHEPDPRSRTLCPL